MAAPLFPVNAHRYDPYRTFMFQVIIDGQPVAGLKKMSVLKKSTEAVKWRTAGDPAHERVMPGGTSYEPITLEQGLTHDPVFENWANRVNSIQGNSAMSLKEYRKDIVLNVLNLQGVVAMSYKVYRAWVSEFQALPEFDAGTMNAVGIQTITVQHEGWERDTAVSEPSEE
ncbi:phage tail protein [Halomonas urumqiensis]|uniref:Phage tail protein n=1 Tax=Halomonas urumqiensis TaxID=1684789 RepID=A0A2N7UD00_9GAMM|nr:phage tail protein [Halomonas urumqiensis]PMR78297.1 phage tail protein [Halomonas urumqiensis]PTB03444.1 phage tail protein [Halomonas urumqiensis]GHE20374.1 phage tail protein [Halomonas urumqiensis]